MINLAYQHRSLFTKITTSMSADKSNNNLGDQIGAHVWNLMSCYGIRRQKLLWTTARAVVRNKWKVAYNSTCGKTIHTYIRESYWQFTWFNAKRNIKHAFAYWGNRLLNKPVLPALADKHLMPLCTIVLCYNHDDVIKWKNFPRYWTFVRGIHRSPLNSPHKSQWRGALMFSLICARINGWVNNDEAEDFRRYRTHYDVTVMFQYNMMLHKALIQHNNVHVGNRQDIVITKNTQIKASAVLTKYVLHGLSVLMKT